MNESDDTVANRKLAERFFEAVFRADRAELLRIFSPDVCWVVPQSAVPPFAGRHHGTEKIADMMLSSVTATFLPNTVRHHILLSMADENRVIVETNMTALQATGREYCNYYVFIFEFEGGLIREIREHVDTAYAIKFFGG